MTKSTFDRAAMQALKERALRAEKMLNEIHAALEPFRRVGEGIMITDDECDELKRLAQTVK